MASELTVHPARLLERLGISDKPSIFVIVATVVLQYIFLFKLYDGYIIRYEDQVIHGNVVSIGSVLAVLGSVVIAAWAMKIWTEGSRAAGQLEKPASHSSFRSIVAAVETCASRSTLTQPPDVFYTPKNAYALEVRERAQSNPAIIVGLAQRKRQAADPESFAAQVGHEISHLELGETRFETQFRRALILHFRVFGWLTAIFLLMLGFIDIRGIGSQSTLAGFVPRFDISIYIQLSSHVTILILSSAIVLVYSYFFIVRREHLHDLRGSQLAGIDALATTVFASDEPQSIFARISLSMKSFFALHPNPTARRNVVRERDFLLVSALLYPAIVTSLQPLTLLLTAGWREFLDIESSTWNVGLTIGSSLLLFGLLRADITRLGVGLLLKPRKYWLQIPLYALTAGLATQLPRLLLEIIFGLRRGFDLLTIVERIWNGSIVGGANIGLMFAAILAALATLSALRVAVLGELVSLPGRTMDLIVGSLLVTGGFMVASLSLPAYQGLIVAACAAVALAYASGLMLIARCPMCRRRKTFARPHRTRCSCGHEFIPTLRAWSNEPFSAFVRRLEKQGG